MVSIYMKQLCIYNMNNYDGTEMMEIYLTAVIYTKWLSIYTL